MCLPVRFVLVENLVGISHHRTPYNRRSLVAERWLLSPTAQVLCDLLQSLTKRIGSIHQYFIKVKVDSLPKYKINWEKCVHYHSACSDTAPRVSNHLRVCTVYNNPLKEVSSRHPLFELMYFHVPPLPLLERQNSRLLPEAKRSKDMHFQMQKQTVKSVSYSIRSNWTEIPYYHIGTVPFISYWGWQTKHC